MIKKFISQSSNPSHYHFINFWIRPHFLDKADGRSHSYDVSTKEFVIEVSVTTIPFPSMR